MANTSKHILVRKASGEMEIFEPEKLLRSLHRAGADEKTAQKILSDVESSFSNGASTQKIYRKALSLLRHKTKHAACRYRIKDAIMELGDSGHPFEIFMGEIYKHLGYQVETAVVIDGKSITHEMDVVATSEDLQHLIECKYSKIQGKSVSIQVPLYVHSRVNDIIALRSTQESYKGFRFTAGVATNTKFSPDCIKYASDYDLNLLSWNYPAGKSLRELIQKERILPITILASLNENERKIIMSHDIVTCEQLVGNSTLLGETGMSFKKIEMVRLELDAALHGK